MSEMMTITTKGQITLPVGILAKYGLNAGDSLLCEEAEDGFIIRKPRKGLLDYKGFIKGERYDPETALASAIEGATAHILGDGE